MRKLCFKKTISVLYIAFLLISINSCSKNSSLDVGSIIDNKLDKICTPSTSSNPYDYIKDNKDFSDIVNMGNDALKYMLTKLKNSKEDGLKEYIMAIACSQILKEDQSIKNWSTGKEWYYNYTKIK
jgi:hypothetical protein